MKIVWDELKRQRNLLKHGMDFADLSIEFFAEAMIKPAKQGRGLAIGDHEDAGTIAVVFQPLGSEAVSIISMRRAGRKERIGR